jgi:hypothetical protein
MPNTYTLISSNVLSSSAASVTFSAIPSTYTDLVVKISARSDRATYPAGYNLRVNASTTDGSSTYIYGDGAAAGSGRQTSNWIQIGQISGANQTANTFTNAEIYIPNYAGSTKKPVSIFNAQEENSAATYVEIDATAGLYNQTTAITSLVFGFTGAYNFVSGSSFYLYGIRSA